MIEDLGGGGGGVAAFGGPFAGGAFTGTAIDTAPADCGSIAAGIADGIGAGCMAATGA